MSSAVRKKAAEYKDKNAVTKTLYNELFTKRDIFEDALRQMGGIENRRWKRTRHFGGSIYSDPGICNPRILTGLETEDLRRNLGRSKWILIFIVFVVALILKTLEDLE